MSIYTANNTLKEKNKALFKEIEKYKSGATYAQKDEEINKFSNKALKYEIQNIKLKDENKKLVFKNRNLTSKNRQNKNQVDSLSKENNQLKKSYNKLEKDLLKRAIDYDKTFLNLKQTINDQEHKLENSEAEISKLKVLNQKMKAQLNRDYTNSSLPSSQKVGRKKICNSRVKTDKKPGGQPGHKGHGRKKHSTVNKIIEISRPEMYADENVFVETGEVITKQVVDILVGLEVTEYHFKKYLNVTTGETVHAPIPECLHNEVSYGNDVKALSILLNSEGNVSIDKTREIIYEISGQNIALSKGFINGLNKKVVQRKEQELDDIFNRLQKFKYMHIDATNVSVNGKNVNVFVTSNPNEVLYYARENKGKKGVLGTAAEDYAQTLIHDHDRTFYNYGLNHQECLAHILRYLQSSMENEPNLTWHKEMQILLRCIISDSKKQMLSSEIIQLYKIKYETILKLADEEYEKNPPNRYFKEGFNLAKRLKKYQEATLYFLEDQAIPYTNNLAERQLRKVKRKAKSVGAFRSMESLGSYCNILSLIELTKSKGDSIFRYLRNTFDKSLNL
jgi:hypothetical protein